MSNKSSEEPSGTSFFVMFLDGPLFLLTVLTATSFLAGYWWLFELTCHFRVQYAIALAGLGTIYVIAGQFSRTVIAWALFIPHAAFILPFYYPSQSEPDVDRADATSIECVSINVSVDNPDTNRVLEWVRERKPDLLLLMEVNLRWARETSELDELFSARKIIPRSDQFGMALYSRQPIREVKALRPAHTTVSVVYAQIEFGGKNVHVTGVHTPSPMGPKLAKARNQVLSGVAERVSRQLDPRIVMGDLNTTSWSPHFRSFLERTGLTDTRKGRGVQPSWPEFMRYLPFRICLDHCLVSEDFAVLDRRVGPDVGSDHLPVSATLLLK